VVDCIELHAFRGELLLQIGGEDGKTDVRHIESTPDPI
jgi:hypothetical protein